MGTFLDNCEFCELSSELLRHCPAISCKNDKDIEDFFTKHADENADLLLGKSYCFVTQNLRIACAFTVSNSAIRIKEMSSRKRRKMQKSIPFPKRRPQVPAVLVGQLAVFDGFSNQGLGDELLDFIKAWFIDPANKTGCRYVAVDAVNHPKVLEFYRRNGFDFIFDSEEEEAAYMSKNYVKPSLSKRILYRLRPNLKPDFSRRTRLMYFDLIVLQPDDSTED